MSDIDLREIDINFRWSKTTPGVINYQGIATGFILDDTQISGEDEKEAKVKGALTPAQFSSLTDTAVKTKATVALAALGTGSHVVTDDTDT